MDFHKRCNMFIFCVCSTCSKNVGYNVIILPYGTKQVATSFLGSVCPAARKFVEASADASGQLMKSLYNSYIESNEDWLSSSVVLNETTSETDRTGGKFSWLTKHVASLCIKIICNMCLFFFGRVTQHFPKTYPMFSPYNVSSPFGY